MAHGHARQKYESECDDNSVVVSVRVLREDRAQQLRVLNAARYLELRFLRPAINELTYPSFSP